MSGLVEGLYEVIGIPNNFAGHVIILTIAGIIFMCILAMFWGFMFRKRW